MDFYASELWIESETRPSDDTSMWMSSQRLIMNICTLQNWLQPTMQKINYIWLWIWFAHRQMKRKVDALSLSLCVGCVSVPKCTHVPRLKAILVLHFLCLAFGMLCFVIDFVADCAWIYLSHSLSFSRCVCMSFLLHEYGLLFFLYMPWHHQQALFHCYPHFKQNCSCCAANRARKWKHWFPYYIIRDYEIIKMENTSKHTRQ